MNKIVVIGLDGATFDLLQPWMDEGHLPTLSRLAAEGVTGVLMSTLPPITAPAWASFMTGKNPGKHGVYDFFKQRAGEFRLVTGDDIDGLQLWEYLSRAGFSAGVVNVPVTHPPRPINGYLIPGLLSPDGGRTIYPAGFLDEYEQTIGSYQLTPRLLYRAGNEQDYISDLFSVLETRIQYALRLAQDHPTDFLMVHFLVTDIAQHTLWKHLDSNHPWHDPELAIKFRDTVRQLYTRIDSAIAELLKTLPDNPTVILMSDHGFGPIRQTVNINNFLIQTGLMKLKQNLGTRVRYLGFKYGITPALVGKALRLLSLEQVFSRWLPGVDLSNKIIGFEDVDWSQTIAYSMGHLGQVYLNVKGREPHGIVESDRYIAVRKQVINALKTLADPVTGAPIQCDIVLGEEVSHGPHQAFGPDLHLIIDNYRSIAYPMFALNGKTFVEQNNYNSGDHRREGIFIAHGPGFRRGISINGAKANIVDLAPTILHLMDVPVPEDMDGCILEHALTPEFRAQHPVMFQEPGLSEGIPNQLSPAEEAEIEDRLRGLGYLG